MLDFLKFSISGERTVYINRNYITDFSYNTVADRTVIGLPGTENYYEVPGDQAQKILEGGGEDG